MKTTCSQSLRASLLTAAMAVTLTACAAKNPFAERVENDFRDKGGAGFAHYVVPAMSEIQRLPDAYPADGIPGGVVRITAAKDEYEPASFVVIGREKLGKVQFSLGEFRNEKGEVFPAADLDLKVIKVWYQNRNGWFSYFGDTGFKLLPELLVNDEDLIRVDVKKEANYARLVDAQGKKSEYWLNPPRQLDRRQLKEGWRSTERFHCLRPDFHDAATLQPVTIAENEFKQFFLTAHVKADAKPGLYRGAVKVGDHGEIPVELRVLDFVLPQPKCYRDPTKDFLVSSYSYISFGIIMEQNGYDLALAKKQLVEVLRDQVAHNQTMHMVRGSMNSDAEQRLTIEAMKEAGMRTDVLMGSLTTQGGRKAAQIKADELDRRYGHHDYFIGYGDEPGAKWLENARPVYEAFQSVGFRFFIAGGDSVFHKAGYLYDWHNIAKDATDDSSTRLWNNMQNPNRIAWYANHHVGTENPAFNRRQNGLAAYLSGYTALCNYAHHFGEYNDDRTTYKPMVFAYGQGAGVIDTLQWEGFREGLDDIRYATLMTDLARKAMKSADVKERYLGGKALHYLAGLDVKTYDQDTARQEMIRFILALKDIVPVYSVPSDFAKSPAQVAAAKAAGERAEKNLAGEVKALEAEIASAKTDAEKDGLYKKIADIYRNYCRPDDGGRYLLAKGRYRLAAGLLRYCAEELETAWLKAYENEKGARAEAFWALLPKHPELIKDFESVHLSHLKNTDTNGYRRAIGGLMDHIGKRNNYAWDEQHAVFTAVYGKISELAKKWNVPMKAETACNAFAAYALTGDFRRAAEAAKAGLADDKAKTGMVYRLNLAATFAAKRGKPAQILAAAQKFDAEYGKGVENKDKVEALGKVGSILQGAGLEDSVRGLNDFRKSLYRPTPKKRYVVRFSDTPIGGVADWDKVAAEETVYDRRYGGSLDFMTTDVSSGERAKATGKETLPDPTMKVVADEAGIHFFFIAKDPKAKNVGMGLAGGGTYEAYIAPGANQPYVCMIMDPVKGGVSFFNTTYSTFGHRRVESDEHIRTYRMESRVLDDRIVTYLMFKWENWPGLTPANGSVWDFENMYWHRAGNSCWNGTESIHGRSTWGELEFALTPAQRVRMLRPLVCRAREVFLRETKCGHGVEGCIAHWTDAAVGDPEFYKAVVEPYATELQGYCDLVKPDMSDSTVEWLAKNALPKWMDITFEISRRRTRWLENRLED